MIGSHHFVEGDFPLEQIFVTLITFSCYLRLQ